MLKDRCGLSIDGRFLGGKRDTAWSSVATDGGFGGGGAGGYEGAGGGGYSGGGGGIHSHGGGGGGGSFASNNRYLGIPPAMVEITEGGNQEDQGYVEIEYGALMTHPLRFFVNPREH